MFSSAWLLFQDDRGYSLQDHRDIVSLCAFRWDNFAYGFCASDTRAERLESHRPWMSLVLRHMIRNLFNNERLGLVMLNLTWISNWPYCRCQHDYKISGTATSARWMMQLLNNVVIMRFDENLFEWVMQLSGRKRPISLTAKASDGEGKLAFVCTDEESSLWISLAVSLRKKDGILENSWLTLFWVEMNLPLGSCQNRFFYIMGESKNR